MVSRSAGVRGVVVLVASVVVTLASAAAGAAEDAKIDALAAKLRQASPELRIAAAAELARLGTPSAVKLLCDGLRDESVKVRVAVVKLLAKLKTPQAIAGLIAAARDKDLRVSETALTALDGMSKKVLVAGLLDALPRREADDLVREEGDRKYQRRSATKEDPVLTYLKDLRGPGLAEALVAGTGHPNPYARMAVVRLLLKRMYDRKLMPTFVNIYLRDADDSVRWAAYSGLQDAAARREWDGGPLGQLQRPQIVDAFLKALAEDKDPRVRLRAAQGVRDRPHKKIVKPMLAALKDPDREVAECAQSALYSMLCEETFATYVEALKDPDVRVRRGVVKVMNWCAGIPRDDPRGAVALIDVLDDDDVEIRRAAVNALYRHPNPKAVPALIDRLRDRDPEVCTFAAVILGRLKDRRATQALIRSVKEGGVASPRAVVALGEIGDPAAKELLIAESKEGRFRKEALEALGKMGGAESVQELIKAYNETEDTYGKPKLLQDIARTGEANASRFVIDEMKKHPEWLGWSVFRNLSLALTDADVDYFNKVLHDPATDGGRAAAILNFFKYADTPRSRRRLVEAMGHENPRIREQARLKVSVNRDGRLAPDLIAAVQHENPAVQAAVIERLDWWGERKAVANLISVLDSKDEEVRTKALRALKSITGEDIGPKKVQWERWWRENGRRFNDPTRLIAALGDPENRRHRRRFVMALVQMDDERAVRALVELFAIDDRENASTVSYLLSKGAGPKAVDILVASLKDPRPRVRVWCIRSLYGARDPRSVTEVIPLVTDKDPEVRAAAVQHLRGLSRHNFGDDVSAWKDWWRKNKDTFQYPEVH